MIRYSLACEKDHDFESWFSDSTSYELQAKRGLVECPHCGSTQIGKRIMAPAVSAARDGDGARQSVVLAGAKDLELREMMRAFKSFVEANSEHVGARFAAEARKIHDGEAEHRAIRGEATPSEVRALLEDGIEVAPLPVLPDERN